MPGRFALSSSLDALAQLFDAAPEADLPEIPNYNVCPTNIIHGVLREEGRRKLAPLRWSFLTARHKMPSDRPLIINARSEGIAEKPAFRVACRERRCLIPATGFYEWTKDAEDNRLPWYIHARESTVLAFAGVWEDWRAPNGDGDTLRTCAVVTTQANDPLSGLHHRMPVVLAAADWPPWLGEAGHGAARLMRAAPDDALAFHRVGLAVTSNRASGPDLIAPLAA